MGVVELGAGVLDAPLRLGDRIGGIIVVIVPAAGRQEQQRDRADERGPGESKHAGSPGGQATEPVA